jgi:hypothetical protein
VNPLARYIDPALLVPALQAIAVVMATILLSLIALLALQKIVLERRDRAVGEAVDRYVKDLAAGRRIEELAVDPHLASQRRALGIALRSGETGVDLERVRAAPWYGALIRHLRKEASHGVWGDRVAAFEMLGLLRTAELRPFLLESAPRQRHPQVYGACLACLAQLCDDTTALKGLWQQLQMNAPLSNSFNEGLIRTAITALGRKPSTVAADEAIRQLLAATDADDPLVLSVIGAIGRSGLASLVPQLALRFEDEHASKALRIACIRAVGMLDAGHPLLIRALADADWEVRASAARYLRGTTAETIDSLAGCLTAPEFYVRLNAAGSLAALGPAGRAVLERAKDSPDGFARDVSRYALAIPEPVHG